MRFLAIAAVALVLLLSVPDSAVYSGEEVRLTGEFLWKHMSHTGDLDATFTKNDSGSWDVEFRFVWDGEQHVYLGTADGSVTEGELRGSIVTDNSQRPQVFFFAGTFEQGRFTGTHTALQASGGKHPTGTLTLTH